MSSFDIALCALLALLGAQGAFMIAAPRRFADFVLWEYRLIGARPAKPGSGTFLFYRLMGVAVCAVVLFCFYRFVTE